MKWFIKGIRNYVNVSGRARRAEYWNFVLFATIFTVVFYLVDLLLFGADVLSGSKLSIFSTLFSLFIFLPNLAVSVRRLHDTDRSGKKLMWYYIVVVAWVVLAILCLVIFMANIPDLLGVIMGLGFLGILVWAIFFLVWFCTPGTPGDNKYGPDPKAVTE